MGRDTCRLPGCKAPTRDDGKDQYENSFCSTQHELKYDHIKADADDARAEARERAERMRDRPEMDGPPY